MRKKEIFIENIEIIEFYDGLIRGIAETKTESFLIVMLAWEIDGSEKLFGFLSIDNSQMTRVRQCFDPTFGEKTIEARWDEFEKTYEDIIRTFSGKIYLLHERPEIHQKYVLEETDYDPISSKLENYEMEKILY